MTNNVSVENSMSNLKELKFYSPLFCRIYRNDSDMMDYPEDITSRVAASYQGEILEQIQKENRYFENDKGLMDYFDTSNSISNKVYSAIPTVEEYGGELFGVLICMIKEELTIAEMKEFCDYVTGQYSDGWGEGFEQ